jgi:adenylylsulfate kinase-like enzyme
LYISHSGVWFYGLAGSGKTFASKIVAKIVSNAFLIDGDKIRRLVSFDLKYTPEDREVQLQRMLGLAELAIENGQYPIISTVSMNTEVVRRCRVLNIQVVQILRPYDQIISARKKLYADSKNVVGKDISQEDLNTKQISNDGSDGFKKLIIQNG